MTEQDLAAPSVAADDTPVSAVTEASEATENTEGQVESQPAEDGSDHETPEEKTKSAQRRERREAANRRALEEAEKAKRELAEVQTRLEMVSKAAAAFPKPLESDFADPLDYVAANAAWQSQQMAAQFQATQIKAEADARQQAQQLAAEAAKAARAREFKDAIPDARAVYADFDAALEIAGKREFVSDALVDIVLDSDRPHDLTYWLGKNPEQAKALSSMNPVQAARMIGQIEASLSRPKPKTQSNAPPPISPVNPTGTARKDAASMSGAEYRAWRMAGGKI
jgi:hypothetical protein